MVARVVDVVMYAGEPILHKRVAYLESVVDTFVVVEARRTFRNDPRDVSVLTHHPKIHHIVLDEFPPAPESERGYREAWFRERVQRDAPLKFLGKMPASQPAVVMVCDVDEVPDVDIVTKLRGEWYGQLVRSRAAIHLHMHFLYGTCATSWPERWTKAFVVAARHLPASLDEERSSAPRRLIENAGWHFSYFMDARAIVDKIKAFSHSEFDTPDVANVDAVEARLRSGEDVLGRSERPYPTPPEVAATIPRIFRDGAESL